MSPKFTQASVRRFTLVASLMALSILPRPVQADPCFDYVCENCATKHDLAMDLLKVGRIEEGRSAMLALVQESGDRLTPVQLVSMAVALEQTHESANLSPQNAYFIARTWMLAAPHDARFLDAALDIMKTIPLYTTQRNNLKRYQAIAQDAQREKSESDRKYSKQIKLQKTLRTYISLEKFPEEKLQCYIIALREYEVLTPDHDRSKKEYSLRLDDALAEQGKRFGSGAAFAEMAERDPQRAKSWRNKAAKAGHPESLEIVRESMWSSVLAMAGGDEKGFREFHRKQLNYLANLGDQRAYEALAFLEEQAVAAALEREARQAERERRLQESLKNMPELTKAIAEQAIHEGLRAQMEQFVPLLFGTSNIPLSLFRTDERFIYNGPSRMRMRLHSFGPCEKQGLFKQICTVQGRMDVTNQMPHAFNIHMNQWGSMYEIPGTMAFIWNGRDWTSR